MIYVRNQEPDSFLIKKNLMCHIQGQEGIILLKWQKKISEGPRNVIFDLHKVCPNYYYNIIIIIMKMDDFYMLRCLW